MIGTEFQQLLEILDLERIEQNLFRGRSPHVGGRDRIFGGQALAQGLVAASRTVESREAHSLHAYFLRPGRPETPILYDVDRIRDGSSFTTRRVVAIQEGEAIFSMGVSFQLPEAGLEHQIPIAPPGEPRGDLYEDEIRKLVARWQGAVESDDRRFALPFEVRTEDGLHLFDEGRRPPRIRTWMRARGALPDDPALHQCLLAYASDLTLGVSVIQPHPMGLTTAGMQAASLDHAMWFHQPLRFDDWLLYEQESPVSARSRGFSRGAFYTRDGVLVASVAQEGLFRYRPPG